MALLLPGGAALAEAPAVGASDAATVGVERYYELDHGAPLWIADGRASPAARRLIAVLDGAVEQGLPIGGTSTAELDAALLRVGSDQAAENARVERMFSEAWVRFVQGLAPLGEGDMSYIDSSLAPRRRFAIEILTDAAKAPSLTDHLDEVAALNPVYHGLAERLHEWRARWDGREPLAIPAGREMKVGDRGERVRLLRMRLGMDAGDRFDSATAKALAAFRKEERLPAGRTADAETVERLNESALAVERRFRANLDRARALPIAASGKYVVVDAAAARLWMMEDGAVVGSMKVVVGKAEEPTPMAAGLIRHVVLRPYWNLPPDLIENKFAGRVVGQGVGYLKDRGYQVLSGWDAKAKLVDPRKIDWKAVRAGRKSVRMRQAPGPGNAMGDIKFMFPNRFGVYLHDTPDKSLFQETRRNFSSGCVRLEDAQRLAGWLFGDPPTGTGAPEEVVKLPRPVPVYLTYLTIDWNGDGLVFEPDVYGRDQSTERMVSSEVQTKSY